MNDASILARVQAVFPDVQPATTPNAQPRFCVPAATLPALARFLLDQPDLAFTSLMDLTGYDLSKYPSTPPSDAIRVVYLLHSLCHLHKLALWVDAPRATPVVPTVTNIWPAAIYFEREVFDLLGVRFDGHPSLHRILCPDDWIGHPLRKDYVHPTEYQGVAHLREGQHFESGPVRG